MSGEAAALVPLCEGERMDAYYYGFDRTGVGAIDRLLSVVAYAGKAFHHTEGWQDDMDWEYGPIRKGETCADAIQRVANESAAAILAALSPDSASAARSIADAAAADTLARVRDERAGS